MRARILLLATLLGVLVSVSGAPAMAVEPGPRAVLHAPRGVAEVGKPVSLTVDLTKRGEAQFDVQVRGPKGWHSALPDERPVRRSRAQVRVVPRWAGRNVYRVVLTQFDHRPHRTVSRPAVVRARLNPRPRMLTPSWASSEPGTATAYLYVSLSRWLPSAPTLRLQQRSHGRWDTIASGTGARRSDAVWWVDLAATVTGTEPIRVVGSGSGWAVTLPVTGSPITEAGAIHVDGPALTLPPADVDATRLVTFDATAGDVVRLLTESGGWRLRLPDGTNAGESYLLDGTPLPTAGRYTLEVRGSSEPVTLRLARPVVASATLDGAATTLPAVADLRIPRLVTFEGQPGDLVIGLATTSATPAASCATHIVRSPDGYEDSFTTSHARTVSVIRRAGTFTLGVSCPTGDAVTVDLQRLPVTDATFGSPVTFAANRNRPLAFRFTTTIDDALVTATLRSTAGVSETWVVSRWDDAPFIALGGYSDRWIPEAGDHLLILEPYRSSDPAATLELTEGPCPTAGLCGS